MSAHTPVRYPCQTCWRDCETPEARERGTCRFCERDLPSLS